MNPNERSETIFLKEENVAIIFHWPALPLFFLRIFQLSQSEASGKKKKKNHAPMKNRGKGKKKSGARIKNFFV